MEPRAAVRIAPADLDDPEVAGLLLHHAATALAQAPRESGHALDLDVLRGADLAVFALRADGELAGVGALRRLSEELGELKAMHTARAHRGRGHGAAMLAHLLAAARREGFRRVNLETGAAAYFAPARALYRRQGFTDCEPFGDYRPDPNSVFMTLVLE